jgi:hypothetical protein
MKPLEKRLWFVLLTLLLSALAMSSVWLTSGLPVLPTGLAVFLFATLGLWEAVHRFLALAAIKVWPSLARVG